MFRNDTAFITPLLIGIEGLLNWYEQHLDPKTGTMPTLPQDTATGK